MKKILLALVDLSPQCVYVSCPMVFRGSPVIISA